jgi:hypothetical protein
MLNPFFTQGTGNEQTLVQNLIDEHIKMHGIEFTYLPRQFVNVKTIMREVTTSKFTMSCPIEGYIQNYDGFSDNHNILTKFGVRSTAEMEIVISQRRFEDSITGLLEGGFTNLEKSPVDLTSFPNRPMEGDLLYFPLGDMLFEIKYVDHEQPSFYQLQNNYTYLLKCELFEYEDEVIDTGIVEIDNNFEETGYNATLTLLGIGSTATAITSIVDGAVHVIRLVNEGEGYTGDPIVRIQPPTTGVGASAVAITTANQGGTRSLQEIYITRVGSGYTFIPNVQIEPTDGKGSGAIAQAGIGTTGSVGVVTVSYTGRNYAVTPTVTFSAPPAGGVTAIGTAVLNTSNQVAEIRVLNAGYGYTEAPTITVAAAGTIGVGTYRYGDYIRGVSTGTTAFVNKFDEPTLTLNARNLTGRFAVGEVIVGEGTTSSSVAYTLNSINYLDDDPYDSAEDFQTEGAEILDFSEENPFGEV